jgi:hypothetical protein
MGKWKSKGRGRKGKVKEVLASSDSEDEDPDPTLDIYVCKWAPGMYVICIIIVDVNKFSTKDMIKLVTDNSDPSACKVPLLRSRIDFEGMSTVLRTCSDLLDSQQKRTIDLMQDESNKAQSSASFSLPPSSPQLSPHLPQDAVHACVPATPLQACVKASGGHEMSQDG